MTRGKFVIAVVMVTLAVLAGATVATVVPPVSVASAAELNLPSSPPPHAAVPIPSFADLAERAIPAVVGITSSKIVESRNNPHGDLFDNPFFRRFFRGQPFGNEDEQQPSQPRRQKRMWGGSGFFITGDGYILTNKHVVEDAENLYVRTSDMATTDEGFKARVIGTDPYLDVAIIKVDVDGRTWSALSLGDSDSLRVGEWVVAIGNPIVFRNSVTVGVVSGKGRHLESGDPSSLGDYIQTDAAINFGNSGGPLLNARGEVVGINTAIIRDVPTATDQGLGGGYVQGIGFALPISNVKRVLNQLAATGTVKRGYLGVSVEPVDPEKAEYLGLASAKGAYVSQVTKDTPADKAGVKVYDVILTVDGRSVSTSEELVNEISSHKPGDKVRLGIWRDHRQSEITVLLAERTVGTEKENESSENESAPESSGGSASGLGFTVKPLPPQMREHLGSMDPPVRGVLISDVDPASDAYSRGLAEGQVLIDINGQPTPTIEAYKRVTQGVKPGQVIRARILDRGGDEATVFFRAPKK